MDSAEEAERDAAAASANLLSCIPELGTIWQGLLESVLFAVQRLFA